MATIRRLGPADAAIYQALRLAGLEEAPSAFGASLEDERGLSLAEVADRLVRSSVFGAFDGDDLVGIAGWYRLSGARMQHRGALWGMYVRGNARGSGLGAELVSAVIADARPVIEQLHLTVVAGNRAALGLYERMGFVAYGLEPRALRFAGTDHDEVMMVLMLEGPGDCPGPVHPR